MKQKIKQFLRRHRHILREKQALKRLPKQVCKDDALRPLTEQDVAKLFRAAEREREWTKVADELQRVCRIEDGKTAGVNPGDRRAVWYLIRGLGPTSVLEIGTNVGASALHMASALRHNTESDPSAKPKLVTVDIEDVNDEETSFWKRKGLEASPRDMIRAIGCGDFVSFVTEDSLTFLERCDDRFDFIFLDGDHSATTVYQEIPRALDLLKPGGLILLHDYFPENRPLWSDGSCVAGTYIAVNRLQSEGAALKVIPLGELPWQTKQESNRTSLALVAK